MAFIQDIRFDSADKNGGLLCDRCGAYIKNIYTVTYSDSLVARYGIECFKKLFDAGKLTDFGRKLMMRTLKKLKEAYEAREKWLNVNSLEEAKERSLPYTQVFETYEAWEGHTFEEFKDFCTSEERGFFASDLKKAKRDLARFKKVNFDLVKFNAD